MRARIDCARTVSADRRAQLAARETELVQALHGGPTPPGLDPEMVALARAGIVRKRARQVARAFPALARDLGPGYQDAFNAFADASPPQNGGALADGLALGNLVARERGLSDEAKVERMITIAGMTTRSGRMQRRRVPYIGAILTRQPPGIVIVAHGPVVGTRVLSLRPGSVGSRLNH
jgi:hypothetical protein